MLERILTLFKTPEPPYALYNAIVAQARQTGFFARWGVADSVEGRFEMLVLHMVLVLDRLQAGSDSDRAAGQALFDTFFRDMDHSLREMGTGDLIVPKKIRTMAEHFYGHAQVYRGAIDRDDESALAAAIARNVPLADTANAALLARYMMAARHQLQGADCAAMRAGDISWPAIETFEPVEAPVKAEGKGDGDR